MSPLGLNVDLGLLEWEGWVFRETGLKSGKGKEDRKTWVR
jgi:hypothetical protein